MRTPAQLTAKYAIKGIWLLLVALVVIASLAFGAYQLTRVEGFRFLFWSAEGWKPRAERLQADLDRVKRAQQDARAAQVGVNQAAEKRYADAAERIDRENIRQLESELAAAERFIRAGGLRPQTACRVSSGAGAAAQDQSAGSGEAAGTSPKLDATEVVVTAEDVRICTVNTLQAEAAREWSLALEAPISN